ncbi:hypothetical protein D5086_001300 [Populus alba]|uniref:Uncharacterized protein n=1 Tax=Populus alba TaxID=43335 RepID=A0ACC4CYI0_POPAL
MARGGRGGHAGNCTVDSHSAIHYFSCLPLALVCSDEPVAFRALDRLKFPTSRELEMVVFEEISYSDSEVSVGTKPGV